MERSDMLIVSLRDMNQGFWSHWSRCGYDETPLFVAENVSSRVSILGPIFAGLSSAVSRVRLLS